MCNELVIRRLAGVLVLASLVLGAFVHPSAYLIAAFVGVNLLQSSFTQWCPAEIIFGRFGLFGCTRRATPA